jgi:methylenetetrahydrofolate--tRNA-(uracil-5-)-methyltransferase
MENEMNLPPAEKQSAAALAAVSVVGAGLAGSECAWQLAKRGIPVKLYEMRPERSTPAHHTADFAELVCSNSLRSDELSNAVGLLKAEMRKLDSLIMRAADRTRVAAGGALAVDRTGFSRAVTETLERHPLVEVVRREVTEIPEGVTVIASGPLSSEAITDRILRSARSSTCIFMTRSPPSSRWRASTWRTRILLPATIRERQIMSTAR